MIDLFSTKNTGLLFEIKISTDPSSSLVPINLRMFCPV